MTSSKDLRQIRANAKGEHRLPAAVAILVTILLYGLLPSDVQPIWLRVPVVVLSVLLLLSVVFVNAKKLRRGIRLLRGVSLSLALMLVVVNVYALLNTVMILLSTTPGDGLGILGAAAQVWATNLIAFAILFWQLDRGGPVARMQRKRGDLPPADLRFPQDEDADTIEEVSEQSSARSDWRPSFIDYFYEAAVASMAFSPGAGVPVRPRAKLILALQSLMSFVLLALVIAHAVGSLGS